MLIFSSVIEYNAYSVSIVDTDGLVHQTILSHSSECAPMRLRCLYDKAPYVGGVVDSIVQRLTYCKILFQSGQPSHECKTLPASIYYKLIRRQTVTLQVM